MLLFAEHCLPLRLNRATVMLRNARLRNQQPITGGLLITCPCLAIAVGHMHIGYILILLEAVPIETVYNTA
jgi:hypothetical protein